MRREDMGKRARTVELEMSKSHYELTAPANSRARNPPAPERMAQKCMAFRPQARPHPPLHSPLFTFPLLQTRAPPPPSPPRRKPLGQAAGNKSSHPVRDRKRSPRGRAPSDRRLARGVPVPRCRGFEAPKRTRTRYHAAPATRDGGRGHRAGRKHGSWRARKGGPRAGERGRGARGGIRMTRGDGTSIEEDWEAGGWGALTLRIGIFRGLVTLAGCRSDPCACVSVGEGRWIPSA